MAKRMSDDEAAQPTGPKASKPVPESIDEESTYLEVDDVLSDFIADGVRYTVRASLMTGRIDRDLFAATGFGWARIYGALQSEETSALWMIAALAFVAERQRGKRTPFDVIEARFPYGQMIEFEWWPPIGAAPPEARGVDS